MHDLGIPQGFFQRRLNVSGESCLEVLQLAKGLGILFDGKGQIQGVWQRTSPWFEQKSTIRSCRLVLTILVCL
jgi:hypothetical protein